MVNRFLFVYCWVYFKAFSICKNPTASGYKGYTLAPSLWLLLSFVILVFNQF